MDLAAGLTRAPALGASPHACGVPVGLLASPTRNPAFEAPHDGNFTTRGKRWSRRPDSHWHGPSRPAGFESAVSTLQPRRDKLVWTEGVALSRACAHRILAPARILFRHVRKKLEHPQGRALCSPSYQHSPSLSTGWMQSGRSGRTRTFVARQGVAFTARCICCSATLRKNGGSSGIRTRDLLLMRELR